MASIRDIVNEIVILDIGLQQEIIEKLKIRPIDKHLLGQISFILESCEKVHYGLLSDSEHALDRNKFIVLLKQLDKKLKHIERSN